MDDTTDRRGARPAGTQPDTFVGSELMAGTMSDAGDRDLYVEEIMAPSPARDVNDRDSAGFGGSRGYAAETDRYGVGGAPYPGGNQEVSRGPAPSYRQRPAAPPPQVGRQTPTGGPPRFSSPQSPPRTKTEHHVDRVPGKKPGFFETLRVNIVPVAFIGVGIGLLVNKKPATPEYEEIHTTVRPPEQQPRPQPQGGYTPPTGASYDRGQAGRFEPGIDPRGQQTPRR